MKIDKQIRMYIAILLIVAFVVALVSPAWADERRYGGDITVNSNNIRNIDKSQDVITTVTASSTANSMMSGNENNIVFDSKAFVMGSHSLGDVDINQCIVTHQKGSFVVSWQGYDYNLWCMGEVFDAKGLPKMGAMMRCDIDEIRRHFSSDVSCLIANTVDNHHNEAEQELLAVLAAEHRRIEEDEEEHYDVIAQVRMEQQSLLEEMEVEQAKDDAKIKKLERRIEYEVNEADTRRALVRAKIAEKEASNGSENNND